MNKVITDNEWNNFIDTNFVSEDVIEIIALRIKYNHEQTEREIAVYKKHGKRIEEKLKMYE